MTLLIEVMEKPLDPGYAQAAAQRRAAQEAGSVRRRSPGTWVGIVALAVVLGGASATASQQLRVPQPAVTETRTVLERQITERNDQVARLSASAEELSREIADLQRSALETQDPGLLDVIRRDALHNGTDAVRGPGLVVSLTDGGGGLVGEPDPSARVKDVDLQTVVNALWDAGAEAISVDDQRLTSRSSIRNAGLAVLVNLVPLPGPTYVVRAVGDAEAMQVQLARSGLGDYLQVLGSTYGIRSSTVAQSTLDLPGAGVQPLQHAQPVGSEP
ncbi:DUF881 domain-containing protein [Xylanimonas ulmi]|uniref:Uncharacterized protein YlxW (UPF0749 family) n=2 Tax=Xylanimonas ulmi TaxID=228973 RepID=A0A4Q7M2R2_9MICO|nr:uncharacterized protein YlxW (UPF0749 family) [Xylanibacterium ulmi]